MTKKDLRKKLVYHLQVKIIASDELKKSKRIVDLKEHYHEMRGFIQAYEFAYRQGKGTKWELLDLLESYYKNEIDSNKFVTLMKEALA
jgi:hypothetical protein